MNTSLLKLRYFGALFLFYVSQLSAQCFISTEGALCSGQPIAFHCNTPGASSFSWDFNGEGTNTTVGDPFFSFSTPGTKVIKLSLKLFNGSTCNAQLTVKVKAVPTIKMKMTSPRNQCFAGNSFCFTDSSTVQDDSICLRDYVFDDGQKFTFSGNNKINFCVSFQDPAGGIYGVTVNVHSCNGCVSSARFNAVARTGKSLGLTFASPQPKRCDSVFLTVTNNSIVSLDSLFSFEWDWGDGTKTVGDRNTPGNWKVQVIHKYKAGGSINGPFDIKLSAVALNGCKESFIYPNAGTIFSSKATIMASADSVCISNSEISFSIKEGQVPFASNPLFIYETPSIQSNITRAWTGKHKFSKPGPHLIKFSFTSSVPGCAGTYTDTILVIGPQAAIELGTPNNLSAVERYQCTIKDTVHFTNFTRYYHNDKNFMDDDSVVLKSIGFNKPLTHVFNLNTQASTNAQYQKRLGSNISHFWDFGDEYCEKCTTDNANKVNQNKNCRYSKDQFPAHLYTDWEVIYRKYYASKPQYLPSYNPDSGVFYNKKVWADDSMAIVRDTVLYYGDNYWGLKAKDSVLFKNLVKRKIPPYINGVARDDRSYNTLMYVKQSDTAFVDPHNGTPPFRYEGPQMFYVLKGNTLDVKSVTDTAFYVYYLEITEDTIPLLMAQNKNIRKKIKTPGYTDGDSIDASKNRQKFYESSAVHCYNARLIEKDNQHPLACSSEQTVSLALMPPSAKHLRKKGYQCLSYDGDASNGVTFMLDDTKPGCAMTWAEINFSYNTNPANWKTAVGKNLSSGNVSMGDFPPVSPPFLTFPGSGAPGSHFTNVYDSSDVDLKTGHVDVGLKIGNGIFPNGNYTPDCQDTMIYKDFVHFPVLDASLNILSGDDRTDYFQFCKYDPVLMAPAASNYSLMKDVGSITYRMTNVNAGKTHDRIIKYYVIEKYKRFNSIHKDSNYLVDSLIVEKHRDFGSDKVLSRTAIPVARVTQWHTSADIGFVYDEFRSQLQAQGININDIAEDQYIHLIWNRKGLPGKPYTGAKGLVDTAGFGHLILFTQIADDKIILHPRDTSLTPLETHVGRGGKSYASYSLNPEYSGFYLAEMSVSSSSPYTCTQTSARRTVVGFYMNVKYADTVICPGSQLAYYPYFRYYNAYPDSVTTGCPSVNPSLLDCTDYWMDRIQEAGNPKREGYTKTDLNKNDDNTGNPRTIFGSFPYAVTGLDNMNDGTPRIVLNSGFIYRSDTGSAYNIRTAASDSNGCRDTFCQRIYMVVAKPGIKTTEKLNHCDLLETVSDQTGFQDPLQPLTGKSSDKILKVTVQWGDNSLNKVSTFFDPIPAQISHTYTKNGKFNLLYSVQTSLGCTYFDSTTVNTESPAPFFDTAMNRNVCRNIGISFNNQSTYTSADSCTWTWDFGDNHYAFQFQQITSANNPVIHTYGSSGNYKTYLYVTYKGQGNTCMKVYPDLNSGESQIYVHILDCDSTGLHSAYNSPLLRMFPNPAGNLVNFETEESEDIQIINGLGEIVATIRVNGRETYDFSHLNSGLYIVRTLDRKYIGKLIISHEN